MSATKTPKKTAVTPKKTTVTKPKATAVTPKKTAITPEKTAVAPKKTAVTKPKAPTARMTLAEAMQELEQAGSAQTRKTYTRHGAREPMFGVSFATLKTLVKRIGIDHELALALWDTTNFDARNLAVKIVDPARMTSADLDRWARDASTAPMCGGYVGMLASEGPHAATKAVQWFASRNEMERRAGWALLGQMAQRDETTPDAWFEKRLAEIESTIHTAPNAEREAMNMAVIVIGCRSAALRKAATAAAKRIGKVEVDHGDTACKTPDAAEYIAKTWAHSTSKGFATPAAHERTRESLRTRC
jgi:3-methyladenine DNA glycosylase AlkD